MNVSREKQLASWVPLYGIPHLLRNLFFVTGCEPEILEILSTPKEALADKLSRFSHVDITLKQRIILVLHYQRKEIDWSCYVKHLALDDMQLFFCAAITARLDILSTLQGVAQECITQNHYEIFSLLASLQYLNVLDYCFSHIEVSRESMSHILEKIELGDFYFFLDYCKERQKEAYPFIFQVQSNELGLFAISHGNLALFKDFDALCPQDYHSTKGTNFFLYCKHAIFKGQLPLLEHLVLQNLQEFDRLEEKKHELLRMTIRYGHLSILQFLLKHVNFSLYKLLFLNSYEFVDMAIEYEHLHIFDYFLKTLTSEQVWEILAFGEGEFVRNMLCDEKFRFIEFLNQEFKLLFQKSVGLESFFCLKKLMHAHRIDVIERLESYAPELVMAFFYDINFSTRLFLVRFNLFKEFLYLDSREPNRHIEFFDLHAPNILHYISERKEQSFAAFIEQRYLSLIPVCSDQTKVCLLEYAVKNKRIAILNHLVESGLGTWLSHSLIQDSFVYALQNDYVEALNFFASHLPYQTHLYFVKDLKAVVLDTICQKPLEFLKMLAGVFPDTLKVVFSSLMQDYVCRMTNNKRLDLLNYCYTQEPEKFTASLVESDYQAFINAVDLGDFGMVDFFITVLPNQVLSMIQTSNYKAITIAAFQGNLALLAYFQTKLGDLMPKIFAQHQVNILNDVASNGQVEVFKYIESQLNLSLLEILENNHYQCFKIAIQYGQLSIIEYFLQTIPQLMHTLWASDHYHACQIAAEHGHLSVIKFFVQNIQCSISEMLSANNYGAYYLAVSNGHLETLKYLIDLQPELFLDGIQARAFTILGLAVRMGHLDIVDFILQHDPSYFFQLVRALDYSDFHESVQRSHHDVLNYLLNSPLIFEHVMLMEKNFEDFDANVLQDYLDNFVAKKMDELVEAYTAAQAELPPREFQFTDLSHEFQYFYFMQYLLGNSVRPPLDILLKIPALRLILASQNNLLLRIALSWCNIYTIRLLLEVPEVRALASIHQMYIHDLNQAENLQEIAEDLESSLRALTPLESKRFEKLLAVYQPVVVERGLETIIQEFKQRLEQRFHESPARLNEELPLPLRWDEFQALPIQEEDRLLALKQYYQHTEHTVWRYLSIPNYWMHPEAEFVLRNPESGEGYAYFEEYLSLIAIFYLASIDEKFPPSAEFSLEDRLQYFLRELAQIARAHNWDNQRLNAHGCFEEYDDLEADRPSCHSGTKRRLHQSVFAHPLFNGLKLEDIKFELRDFVRNHYVHALQSPEDKLKIKNIFDKIIEGDNVDQDYEVLRSFDIPLCQQQIFIDYLYEKYGMDLVYNLSFQDYVNQQFKLTGHYQENHLVRFSSLIGLEQLLASQQPHIGQGFFAHHAYENAAAAASAARP